MLQDILKLIVTDAVGIEVGGPSHSGNFIYKNAQHMDNVVFNNNTVWHTHGETFNYYEDKTGKNFINDAVNISLVKDNVYDFSFSSHCLEHIANPLKAIEEQLRIVKSKGFIIIIVPEKSCCFDHKREYSVFSTLLSQYKKNVGEDDLSTLPEILENHDLTMDLPAGDYAQFHKRSLDNFQNRCLHHYVYSPTLLKDICNFFECNFVNTVTNGLDIWFIMRKK